MRRRLFLLVMVILLAGCANTSDLVQSGKTSFAKKDYKTAYDKLLPAARRGDADAEYAVGYLYYYGKGVPQDQAAGKDWIAKAAAQGQPQAVQALAMIEKRLVTIERPKKDPIETLH